jgi:hypothetical protein
MISSEDILTMRRCAARNKKFHAYAEINAVEIFYGNAVKNLDALSNQITGSSLAKDISFSVVDTKPGDVLVLSVYCDVSDVIKELNEFQLSGGVTV